MAGSDDSLSTKALRADSNFWNTSAILCGVGLGKGSREGSWGHAKTFWIFLFACCSVLLDSDLFERTYQIKTAVTVTATRVDIPVNIFHSFR